MNRFTFMDAVLTLAVLAIIAGVPLLQSAGCKARWQGTGYQTQWGLLTQCRITKDGKTWIPERSYREVSP